MDETGSHLGYTPRYAYAPRGQRASATAPVNRGEHKTVVAALTLDGVGPHLRFAGAMTTARFVGYIRHVLAPSLRPGQVVIAGTAEAVARAGAIAKELGARRVMPFPVAGAFHTALMKPADVTLAQALASVALKAPRIPVWSNVDAQAHTDPGEIRDLLVRQVVQPMLWEATLPFGGRQLLLPTK